MTTIIPDENDILYAFEFDGKGGAKRLTDGGIVESFDRDAPTWVHVDVNEQDVPLGWLQNYAPFLDQVTINALIAKETRPRISDNDHGALIILRGVNLNETSEPEDMISIRLWVDRKRIITTRLRKLKSVQDIRERLEAGKGPKNVGDFLTDLISRLFERMEPVILDLQERTDNLEEQILDKAEMELRNDVIDIRRSAIILKRYIAPQKEVISYLRNAEFDWLSDHNKRHLHESYDRTIRYIEDLDSTRERAQIVKEELSSMLADKMNRNMYTLSIVAAIFLPLSFLTGLMGINVGGMPGVESDYGFWLVALICVIFTLLVGGVFKFMRWI